MNKIKNQLCTTFICVLVMLSQASAQSLSSLPANTPKTNTDLSGMWSLYGSNCGGKHDTSPLDVEIIQQGNFITIRYIGNCAANKHLAGKDWITGAIADQTPQGQGMLMQALKYSRSGTVSSTPKTVYLHQDNSIIFIQSNKWKYRQYLVKQ